ncbi:MAG: hypothetical protein AAGI17_03415 [Planctomycetota bacterium]
MKPRSSTDAPLAPAVCRYAVLGLGPLGTVVAAWGVVQSLKASPPTWVVFALAVVGVVAGLFAVPFGRGRHRDGFGLGVLNIAGVFVAVGLFGWLDARENFGSRTLANAWGGAQAAIGFGLVSVAVVAVLSRANQLGRSWGRLAVGVGLLVASGGAFVVAQRFDYFGLTSGGEDLAEAFKIFALLVIGLVAIAVLAASTHLIISAFETGHLRTSGPVPGQDAGADSAAETGPAGNPTTTS